MLKNNATGSPEFISFNTRLTTYQSALVHEPVRVISSLISSVKSFNLVWCPWSLRRASQSLGRHFDLGNLVSALGSFTGSQIRRQYWCYSWKAESREICEVVRNCFSISAESREISISCKNLFLNQCKINTFLLISVK